jgi:hypothetical protein
MLKTAPWLDPRLGVEIREVMFGWSSVGNLPIPAINREIERSFVICQGLGKEVLPKKMALYEGFEDDLTERGEALKGCEKLEGQEKLWIQVEHQLTSWDE